MLIRSRGDVTPCNHIDVYSDPDRSRPDCESKVVIAKLHSNRKPIVPSRAPTARPVTVEPFLVSFVPCTRVAYYIVKRSVALLELAVDLHLRIPN